MDTQELQRELIPIRDELSALRRAVEKLTLIEERQTQQNQRIDRLEADFIDRCKVCEQRLQSVEEGLVAIRIKEARSETIGRWVERAIYGLLMLGVYYLASGGLPQ